MNEMRMHGETSCVRSVGVPELDRNFLTHPALSQKMIQALGDGSVSQSVGRTPDGSGHMWNRRSSTMSAELLSSQ